MHTSRFFVAEIGFKLAGPSDFTVPPDAISGQGLRCCRLLLVKLRQRRRSHESSQRQTDLVHDRQK